MKFGIHGPYPEVVCKLLVISILTAVPLAFADTKVTYDKGGMPRCLSSGSRELIFVWEGSERYSREIFALDTGTYKAQNDKKFSCKNPPVQVSDADVPQLFLVKKDEKKIAGFDLTSPRLQRAFAQIRNGGNQFYEEKDAREYLGNHPNLEFNLETNRKLTAQFGVGFVSELYGAWLEARPENRKFYQAVSDIIKKKQLKIPAKRTVVYVKGMFQELKSSQRYNSLIEHLKGLGLEVVVAPTLTSNGTRANVISVLEVLDRELKRGKNVILIGLSKGGLEALTALSAETAKLEGRRAINGYGQVEAFISLSGIYSGSFEVDGSMNTKSMPRMQDWVYDLYTSENITPTSLIGMIDLQTSHVEKTFETIKKNGLPQNTVYISIVATTGGNGLAAPGFIRKLQDEWIRPFSPEAGANDGYVEYPGTQIPRHLVKEVYEINVRGTHILVDGEFEGAKMLEGKPSVVHAILGAVFQLIEGRST